jgi:CRP-like cAMP-binding protein
LPLLDQLLEVLLEWDRVAGNPKPDLIYPAFLQRAGPGRHIRVYRDKEVVYSQESPADAVFYLQSGMVKLTMVSKCGGKKAVLALLQRGDLFGEGCLAKYGQRMSTATSLGTSTITRLDEATFRRKIDRDRVFAAMFITYLISRTVRLKEDLADHCLNSSQRRLARILLMYRSNVETSRNGASTLRFSQATLAEMVGTTRSRVSGFMNEFRKKGYVRYHGGLERGGWEVDAEGLTAFLQS